MVALIAKQPGPQRHTTTIQQPRPKHHGFGMTPNTVIWGLGSFKAKKKKRLSLKALGLQTLLASLIGNDGSYKLVIDLLYLAELAGVSKPSLISYLEELETYGSIKREEDYPYGQRGHKLTHITMMNHWSENDALFDKEKGHPPLTQLLQVDVRPTSPRLVPKPPQNMSEPVKNSSEPVKNFDRSSENTELDRSKTFTDSSSPYKRGTKEGDRAEDAGEENTQGEGTSSDENTTPAFPLSLEPLMYEVLEALKVDRSAFLEMLLEKYAPNQALNLKEIALEVRSYHKEKTTASKFRDSILHELNKPKAAGVAPSAPGAPTPPRQLRGEDQLWQEPTEEEMRKKETTHFTRWEHMTPGQIVETWRMYKKRPAKYEEHMLRLPVEERLPMISEEELKEKEEAYAQSLHRS